jgi:hypothetical protein
MQTFAEQSAIALENARLFNEIAQKSRELEIASHHNVAVRRGAYVGRLRDAGIPVIELAIGPCGHESPRITSDGLACEGPCPRSIRSWQELVNAMSWARPDSGGSDA